MNLPNRDRVSPEDLTYLRRLQEELKQAQMAVLRAEGALAGEARRLREHYGIDAQGSVDVSSGIITRGTGQTTSVTVNGTGPQRVG